MFSEKKAELNSPWGKMVFVYFQRPYVTNAQTSGKIRPDERNTSKMVMSDSWLVLTKSPKIFIRATIGA